MTEEDELFDDDTQLPEAEVETPEPQAEPPVEPEPEEPEETPEGAAQVEVEKPEQPMVPLAALHEVRDELKQLKAEAERHKAEPKAEQQQPIDPWEDLDGALNQRDQQFQSQLYQTQLKMSERFARQQHGDETVQQALEWGEKRCAEDPYFNAKVMQSGDPVGFAVEQFQREQIASKVDLTEYEQFQAWKAAQAQAAQQPGQETPPPKKPSRSIASAPSAGGVQHVALGEEAIFDEEFN